MILVEDDYQIRSGLSRFFPWKQLGFDFLRGFENGKQALEFLTLSKVDVVLTDIRMPVMDGLELASRLKQMHPETLVVFMSAYRDFDYARQAVEIGVHKYIVKSTKYDELVQIFTDIRADLDARARTQVPAQPPDSEPAADDRMIRKIIEGIRADVAGATLQSLAQKVSMSPAYLSRYFKEKTGINFVDYVVRLKMVRAAELLRDTDCTIAKISEIVGYSNEKNFSRAFRKYYNATPFDYRRRL